MGHAGVTTRLSVAGDAGAGETPVTTSAEFPCVSLNSELHVTGLDRILCACLLTAPAAASARKARFSDAQEKPRGVEFAGAADVGLRHRPNRQWPPLRSPWRAPAPRRRASAGAGLAMIAAALLAPGWSVLALLILTGLGISAAQGVFWTVPSAVRLGGERVPAGAIALISMFGTAGGS